MTRRELHFSREQIDLIKENVAKGTTDEQLALFLHICKKHRLDPLAKQIYCVLWPRSGGGHDMVVITGINGFRSTAARDHKDFAGTSKATFVMSNKTTPRSNQPIPESCTMQGFKKTRAGIQLAGEMEVFWCEFAPVDLTEKRADFWRMKPRHMLQKCCEAQLLRKLYPDLSDVYVEEELTQRMQDFTPGGREIVVSEGMNPSGRTASTARPAFQPRQSLPAKPVDTRTWCSKHQCDYSMCPADEHTAAEHREIEKLEEEAKKASAKPPETPKAAAPVQYNGTIKLDLSNPNDPFIWGHGSDLAGLMPTVVQYFKTDFRAGWVHVSPKDIPGLRELCEISGYRFIEELVNKSSRPPQKEAKPETETTKPASGNASANGAPQTPPPAESVVVSGTIKSSLAGMCGTTPVRDVTLLTVDGKSPSYRCFDKKLFERFDKGLGLNAEFVIKKNKSFWNIVSVRKIGSKEWLDDGTPAIQTDREPGTRTLWNQ